MKPIQLILSDLDGTLLRDDKSLSPYTQEELASKAHNYELEKCGETVLCVDYKMSGVGSNSCGPLLMPQYQLNEETFDFAFTLTVE